mmetsp:Transcript_13298/g.26256  ORF Transcript_13298/g.26256 Transcript_13298/m.26256 type:complete len:83 (-) Transcript_13298:1302-1550(-)
MCSDVSVTVVHSGGSEGDSLQETCAARAVRTVRSVNRLTLTGPEDSVIEALSAVYDRERLPLQMILRDTARWLMVEPHKRPG